MRVISQLKRVSEIKANLVKLAQTQPKPGGRRSQQGSILYGFDPARGGEWQQYVGPKLEIRSMKICNLPCEGTYAAEPLAYARSSAVLYAE